MEVQTNTSGRWSYSADLSIFQAMWRDFVARKSREVLVVYDVDDLMWPLTIRLAQRGGIDVERVLSNFTIRGNPLLTPEEQHYIIDGFGKVESFRDIQFYDGVQDILKPRELGAKVVINSNSFSQEISEAKTEQLLAAVPGLGLSDIQMNVINYSGAQSKALHRDIAFLAEDSPHNVAKSDALCSVVPSYMNWAVCPSAIQTMLGKRVVARSTLTEINQFIYDGTRYIVERM